MIQFKTVALWTAGALFLGVASPALAGAEKDAVLRFNAYLEASGFDKVQVGSVEERGDAVVLRDYSFHFGDEFKIDHETTKVDLTVSFDELVLSGYSENAEGYRFAKLEAPQQKIVMVLDDGKGEDDFRYELISKNTVIDALHIPTAPELADKTKQPVSRYVPLVLQLLEVGYDKASAGPLSTLNFEDGVRTSWSEVSSTLAKNSRGGVTEFVEYGAGKGVTFISPEDTQGAFAIDADLEARIEQGPSSLTGLDLRPLRAYLTGTQSPSGLLLNSSEAGAVTIEVIARAKGAEGDAEKQIADFSIGEQSVSGVRLQGGNAANLLALLDKLVLENEETALQGVDPTAIASEQADFTVDKLQINDISVKVHEGLSGLDATVPEINARLGGFEMNALTNTGLGDIQLNEFYVAATPQSPEVEMGAFALQDIVWPSLTKLIATMEDDSLSEDEKQRKLMPQVGVLRLVDLLVDYSGGTAPLVTLESMESKAANYQEAIPTQLSTALKNLSVNMPMLGIASYDTPFGSVSLDTETFQHNLDVSWDVAAGQITLTNLDFEIADGLFAEVSFTLGSVPAELLVDPDGAGDKLMLATFDGGYLRLKDAPMLREMLENGAKDRGVSFEAYVDEVAAGLSASMGPLGQTQFGKDVVAALTDFAQVPDQFELKFSPAQPLPLIQLATTAMVAPDQLQSVTGGSVAVGQ
ncbi:hypothetical protein [Polycladidibacter hongkongensis]|uniref:hypothetical protein n=1 Tax=Polycladidibacter hongkongensis TaxID=1647556 RepID=UPI000830916A|nr:hypothetical protein [Pseudovibrio hongkongensis]